MALHLWLQFGYGFESCDENGPRNIKNTHLAKQRPVSFPNFLLVGSQDSVLKVPKRGQFHAAIRVTPTRLRAQSAQGALGRRTVLRWNFYDAEALAKALGRNMPLSSWGHFQYEREKCRKYKYTLARNIICVKIVFGINFLEKCMSVTQTYFFWNEFPENNLLYTYLLVTQRIRWKCLGIISWGVSLQLLKGMFVEFISQQVPAGV